MACYILALFGSSLQADLNYDVHESAHVHWRLSILIARWMKLYNCVKVKSPARTYGMIVDAAVNRRPISQKLGDNIV